MFALVGAIDPSVAYPVGGSILVSLIGAGFLYRQTTKVSKDSNLSQILNSSLLDRQSYIDSLQEDAERYRKMASEADERASIARSEAEEERNKRRLTERELRIAMDKISMLESTAQALKDHVHDLEDTVRRLRAEDN